MSLFVEGKVSFISKKETKTYEYTDYINTFSIYQTSQ